MTDKEILDMEVGAQAVKDMTAITFLHWVAKKIDGRPAYGAANVELTAAVSAPPLANRLEDSEKVRLVRKMLQAGITLP